MWALLESAVAGGPEPARRALLEPTPPTWHRPTGGGTGTRDPAALRPGAVRLGGAEPGSLLHGVVERLLALVTAGEPEGGGREGDLPALCRPHSLLGPWYGNRRLSRALARLLADEPAVTAPPYRPPRPGDRPGVGRTRTPALRRRVDRSGRGPAGARGAGGRGTGGRTPVRRPARRPRRRPAPPPGPEGSRGGVRDGSEQPPPTLRAVGATASAARWRDVSETAGRSSRPVADSPQEASCVDVRFSRGA